MHLVDLSALLGADCPIFALLFLRCGLRPPWIRCRLEATAQRQTTTGVFDMTDQTPHRGPEKRLALDLLIFGPR